MCEMTEKWFQEGKREGRREGKREGVREGKRWISQPVQK